MPIEFKFIEDMKEVSATSYITIVKGKDFPEEHPKLDAKTLGQIKQSQKFKGKLAEVFSMNVLSHDKLIECSFVGADGELKGDAYLKLGGDIYKAAQKHHEIVLDTSAIELEHEAMCDILIGFQLASYKFDKYFVDKETKEEKTEKHILYIYGAPNKASIIEEAQYISASVSLARDLVNEPANVLSTTEFKKRILDLKSIGLKIEILEKSELEKLDMHALLGVARGSACPPYVAIMRWNGSQSKEDQPLVFVGKGVVFDSGGISLKRPDGMEEMKGDMGGAASVVGLMHCLAKRKAKIHAVGIIGLVENMVDAAAQRPGDVVKSRSGQTIEIVNTDAEGRLVLADVLHYAIEKFKPKIVVDLATLTGAVLIALGNTMAGLFSNDEALTQNLLQAASKTGEKLWHMPLCEEYDKQIDSKIADMRNSAGRLAASSTAAQFLKRFVGEVAWAHLDIEGTAFDAPKLSYSTSWATGFGVRLLNNMIKNTYEK